MATNGKILDVVVPEGLHNKVRKSLAKITHPDVSKVDAAAEMVKINTKLDKIKSIQTKSTHIQFVVDSSGSMTCNRKKLVEAYNKLLERQSRYASKSTYGYKSFHEEIKPEQITRPRYMDKIETRGGTPLFDTIGYTINKIDERLGNPTDVVVIILTDGNDTGPDKTRFSEHYSAPELQKIIQDKISIGWQFIYCNQTEYKSLRDAERIGIPKNCTTTFEDYNKLLGKINQMLLSYRQGDVKQLTFNGDSSIKTGSE